MEERIGHVLCGKYTLQRLLGQGGMASVYEATHRNGLRVAIKVLAPELCANADVKARFLREGYVANAVEHPRVVRVLDDDVDQGTVFLVLELLRGESVAARAARFGGRLPEAMALDIAMDLCDVLEAAHALGIVHRDLKPDNLFLDETSGLRVLDFGIARFKSSCASTLGTRTGVLLGTPGFMPKEQALGEMEAIDARTDLWAVGATLHTLLVGKPVHEARTPEAMLVKVCTEAVPPVRSLAPWVSEATAEIVDRALKTERDDATVRRERCTMRSRPHSIVLRRTKSRLRAPCTPQRSACLLLGAWPIDASRKRRSASALCSLLLQPSASCRRAQAAPRIFAQLPR